MIEEYRPSSLRCIALGYGKTSHFPNYFIVGHGITGRICVYYRHRGKPIVQLIPINIETLAPLKLVVIQDVLSDALIVVRVERPEIWTCRVGFRFSRGYVQPSLLRRAKVVQVAMIETLILLFSDE